MKKLFSVLFIIIISGMYVFSQTENNKIEWLSKSLQNYNLFYSASDSSITPEIADYINSGVAAVEKYFTEPFKKKFDVYVFPSRKYLDEQWGKDWGIHDFKSECWMVASGVANRLDILSPASWSVDACEHDDQNKEHIKKLITHELVHVFHAQNNPVPDFSGMDDLGWFIEGLAVLVSGQLDENRLTSLQEAIDQNKLPQQLKNAWSGKYRYAVCGSIVKFVETRWGKNTIVKLLGLVKEEDCLRTLGTDEAAFLSGWKKSLVQAR